MAEPVAWSYVDDRRTHRIDTAVHRGRTLELVIEERALDSDDPHDVYVERHALIDPWDARVHQLALESRLALLGNYYRTAGGGWTPLKPAVMRTLESTPLVLDGESDAIGFHHYQSPESRHAVTLVAVREEMSGGRRTLLARLDYTYPEVHGGNLQVIHARLPPQLYRSALASQHLELRELGFEKLANPTGTMDARSWTALRATLETILFRLVEGRLGKGGEEGGGRGSTDRPDLTQALETLALLRKTRDASNHARTYDVEDELGPTLGGVEGKKPTAMMEELPQDIMTVLSDPRLAALHGRFFAPGEDAALIEEGELGILRAMRDKREKVPPHEQHLVSIVEASLLLRRALTKRTRVDPEVITRVRHAGAYL